MFKEVDAKTAVLAALDGEQVYMLNDKSSSLWDLRDVSMLGIMSAGSRFLIDDPDYKTPERETVAMPVYNAEELARCFEEAQNKKPLHFDLDPEQNEVKADQNIEKADQSEPKAYQAKKPGKTARKDIDEGKMLALHNAGWSIAKIADEMGVSASVIQRRLTEAQRTK